ncbi:hypothetical protein IAU60_001472 [Kwoniella sp. DSM 27419]
MPSQLSSPPLRLPRSPGDRDSPSYEHFEETPRQKAAPTSPYTSMTRSSKHALSPHRVPPPPPVPRLPQASAIYSRLNSPIIPTSPMIRSSSGSSSSSEVSFNCTKSQQISTPIAPTRVKRTLKSNPELLPALSLPLTPDQTRASPGPSPRSLRSQRFRVEYPRPVKTEVNPLDDEQSAISREEGRSRAVIGSVPNGRGTAQVGEAYLEPFTASARSSRSQGCPITPALAEKDPIPPRPVRRTVSASLTAAAALPADSSFSSAHEALSFSPQLIGIDHPTDLSPTRGECTRSTPPSGVSITTIRRSPVFAPRPSSNSQIGKRTAPSESKDNHNFAVQDFSTPMNRRRDSAQRRLSALRGLVANLDFNQPWSVTEATPKTYPEELLLSPDAVEADTGAFGWAYCGEQSESDTASSTDESLGLAASSSDEALGSPIRSASLPHIREEQSQRSFDLEPVEEHGWPAPKPPVQQISQFFPTNVLDSDIARAQIAHITPVRRNSGSMKQPSSTPPRRPRQFRASSELLSRTPEPPRPGIRARREVFDVASSGYSKCIEPVSSQVPVTPTTTWRSYLTSDDVYARLMQEHGPMEITRQEIIWELCETEQAFVKSMRTVLRLFATPLKTPQGNWIDGIPDTITDLFDSLEGIAHTHGIVSAAERDMRRKSDVLEVGAFVTLLKSWVHRLETHEWYLLKFESVVALVEENVRDPDSVFGEFVRMQMKEEIMGSMGLGSMLLKPVQRLTKYPLFFKRLLDATPQSHPVHAEILSLLSTTESIILALQATKAREEDFEQLQSLETKLVGLPEGFSLAIRGRKLLGQGQLVRVPPGKDLAAPTVTTRARAGSLHSSRGSVCSTVSSSAPSSIISSSPWDFSSSLTPSRTSAFSISSNGSSFCSGPPSRSNSINRPSPSFSALSSFASPSRPSVTRSPSTVSSFTDQSRPSTPSTSKSKRKDEMTTLLVFDDLVLVGTQVQDKGSLFGVGPSKKKGLPMLRVLPELEGGIGKVVEVKDWSGWNGHAGLFTITIMPISDSARVPSSPITTAWAVPAPTSSMTTSSSLRSLSLKPSSTGVGGGISSLGLSCPTLTSIAGFMTALSQLAAVAEGGSEYAFDGREPLVDQGQK